MNKLFFLLICFILPITTFAQKNKKVTYTISNIQGLTVDANLQEWNNNLNDVGTDFWSFGIAEQNGELFVALAIKDLQLQREAFRGGLFVDIGYTEKKKSGARFEFPYWDRERKRALANNEELSQNNYEEELLNNVNGYFVKGFGKVRDGVLALENDYGIEAKVKLDSNRYLIFEARIPIDLVGIKTDRIAINFGINTQHAILKRNLEQTNNRNTTNLPYYMMGRPQMQNTIKSPYKYDTDVWVIDNLSK